MPGYKVMKYPGSTQAVFSAHLCAMKKNYYAIGGSHGVRIIAGFFHPLSKDGPVFTHQQEISFASG
jgi:hypothetical protein